MKPPIKVILVEDHPGYREVIARTLRSAPQLELVSQFGTAEVALRELQNQADQPDIVLLDLNLPGMSGIEAIPWFLNYAPDIKVIIITQSDKETDIMTAISRGASGYLLKSSTTNQIKESIQTVADGGASLDPSVAKHVLDTLKHRSPEPAKSLTTREREILTLLADGLVKKEIAGQLDIAVTTVAYHIKHIYEKLEVQNAPAAVSKGYKSGLL
ncbi:MAG: response regulator [Verrucomicrobiales bacterium]|nr:response regulator transcription factor [Verrucomicrobiota bacterium JB025]